MREAGLGKASRYCGYWNSIKLSIMSSAVSLGPSISDVSASSRVIEFIASAKKSFAVSGSANAVPPMPNCSNKSSAVCSTCSSDTSGPQRVSLITFFKLSRPDNIAGSDAAISPTVSRALHIASPIISHILTRIRVMTRITSFIISCFIVSKRILIISDKEGK